MKLRLDDRVLLFGKDESYLVTVSRRKFNVKSGIINLGNLIGKSYGSKIKTHIGKEFCLVKPTVIDYFSKLFTRGAQVILPKDISLILAYTGISPDSFVVDAGTGSGYLTIFLAHYLSGGKVVTYEKDKRFVRVAKENIKSSGLKNIRLKKKDISKCIDERNVDMITLDLQHPGKIIKNAYKSLAVGGWLVVYSPTVDEMFEAGKKMKKYFSDVKIVENIVREWQSERTLRPKTMGLMHTGWLMFGRKVSS
ncbi:MAG: tRNA (adenine-N1)-methyltransferase [Candidatus Aenigmarchaeota archaeon]|nr:tRNA (adenine-N1)-methyltransferase [Candidatus Aenigmarchaeota archaeon]